MPPVAAEHVDVLIVGAGLSGIGAAYHLQAECPGKTYAILEARDAIGGTWDLFRYPGHPLGLRHAHARLLVPALEGGEGDRRRARRSSSYVRETASENGIDRKIRFGHRVVARRVVDAGGALDGRGRAWSTPARPSEMTCNFLHVCSGYYRYDEGYTPEFAGTERFGGRDRPPAAVARGPRLRRQAGRRDRQRRDRGHPGAGDGGDAPRT